MKNNLVQLELNETLAFKFISLGIKDDIKFYIFNTKTNKFFELSSSQLQLIQNAHPKKIILALEESNFAGLYNGGLIDIAHSQLIHHSSLWLDEKIREKYLKKFNGEFECLDDINLTQSKYWNHLSHLTKKAIKEYPKWKKSRASKRKHFKTSELGDWLKLLGAKTTREAEAIKKTLSDFFEELQ
jgi:hypothetical protein